MKTSLAEVLKVSIPSLRDQRLHRVSVAVIDSGIDALHEALEDRVSASWGFTRKADGEIIMKKLPRANNDFAGHGTAVASIIHKVAPNADIIDFRVLNADSGGTGDVMLRGLEAAIASDAKIINMSLACLKKYQNELASLCELAYQKRKIIVASKRNMPKIGDLGFPAELSSCISIDNKTFPNPFIVEYTNEKPIEFAALGEAVLVARNGGGYYRLTGTSFATPTVSGIVALLLGKYPDLDIFEIKSILKYHSLFGTYRKNAAANPMEIAERKQTACKKGVFSKCNACGKIMVSHEAFSHTKCPECGKVLPLVSLIDKGLYREVLHDLQLFIPERYHYHNRNHAQEAVFHVISFLSHYPRMSRSRKKCLVTAALLHDYGFRYSYTENEPLAARYAAEILPKYNYSGAEIELVQRLILATTAPVKPADQLEKIICDADIAHIGTPVYYKKSCLLRQEREEMGMVYSDRDWMQGEIKFLSAQRFFQPFLEKERQAKREEAIKILKKEINAVRKSSGKPLIKQKQK